MFSSNYNDTSFFKKNLYFIIFFLFLLIVNFFLYSLISITIYKILCFNVDYFIFYIYKLNKSINVFYLNSLYDINFINSSLFYYTYKCYLTNIYLKNVTYFYLIDFISIKYLYFIDFYYLKQNISYFNNILYLNFFIRSSNFLWVDIISLQKTLIINLGETGLFFFRMFNPTHLNLKLITIYIVYPNESSLYLNKIQCFCYNLMFLYPLELVDLPVLFFVDNMFIYFYDIKLYNNIFIYYITFFN